MTYINTTHREVVFTDYECSNDSRIEVVVSMDGGPPIANIRHPMYPTASLAFADDIKEPDLLRSYAHAMLAAADEMEKMK